MFLIIAAMSILVYILPPIYAMFAGQHQFVVGDDCLKCHEDVGFHVNMSQDLVLRSHRAAANNTNYTTYLSVGGIEYNKTANESYAGRRIISPVIYTMHFVNDTIGNVSTYDVNDTAYFWNTTRKSWENTRWNGSTFVPTGKFKLVRLDVDGVPGIGIRELCDLCHNATLFDMTRGVHTNVTVRVCDDDRCHGNANNSYNDLDLFDRVSYRVVYAGRNLSTGIHREFYLNSSRENSSYLAGTPFGHRPGNAGPGGVYISRGFWTCLGCHSEVVVGITWVHPTTYMHVNATAPRQRYR